MKKVPKGWLTMQIVTPENQHFTLATNGRMVRLISEQWVPFEAKFSKDDNKVYEIKLEPKAALAS